MRSSEIISPDYGIKEMPLIHRVRPHTIVLDPEASYSSQRVLIRGIQANTTVRTPVSIAVEPEFNIDVGSTELRDIIRIHNARHAELEEKQTEIVENNKVAESLHGRKNMAIKEIKSSSTYRKFI